MRLSKFLDALESLGLIVREQSTDEMPTARYMSREPFAGAAEAVLGDGSIERDRNTYPWCEIHGRLSDVLNGQLDAPFAWPPLSDEDVRAFESSMAAGCAPIIETLRGAADAVFDFAPCGTAERRWLDVGGAAPRASIAFVRCVQPSVGGFTHNCSGPKCRP